MSQIPAYFGAECIKNVLKWPLINAAVEEAMKAVSNTNPNITSETTSHAKQPARSIIPSPGGVLFSMSAFVGNYNLSSTQKETTTTNTLACKLVTSFTGNLNLQPAMPSILANILLFSTVTGQLEAILDGTQITAWRTAAASIVATKYLYFQRFPEREQKAVKVAIIGCGVQGESHALGMCATFNVTQISLWNRTHSKATSLAELLQSEISGKTHVVVAQSSAEAVADADIICVGTYSANALVDYGMLQKNKAVHINSVGAGQVHFGEVAQDIYNCSKVYVDSWTNAKSELKDLKANIVAEVGEIINNGKYPKENEITIFQSMGMAAEDATVAQAVYNQLKNV